MDINTLAEQLRDPDPHVRVTVLRILAMVEETRALPAIRWIYKHDPEPGVREVANWAGRLIFQAHQRGHSTQKAVEEMFERPLSPDLEERFLASLQFNIENVRNLKVRQYATEQEYRRKMADALQTGTFTEQLPPEDDAFPALPPGPAQED
ncbi:MAG: HEAT repeat domain-containing protein [Chloroflexi bacterium]|nr:HEAT repeat domain-containing protein [Chloroflexota bacterium]